MPNKRKRSISPRTIIPSPAFSTTSSINEYANDILDNEENLPLPTSRKFMIENLPTQEEVKDIYKSFQKNKKGGKKKKRKTTKKNNNKRKYTIRRRRR